MELIRGSLYVRINTTCLVVRVGIMMASYKHYIVMYVTWPLLCELLGMKVWPLMFGEILSATSTWYWDGLIDQPHRGSS